MVAIGLNVDPCGGCGLVYGPLDFELLGVIGGNEESWIVVLKGVQKLLSVPILLLVSSFEIYLFIYSNLSPMVSQGSWSLWVK